jgi:Leucine-rich repeat (LRR) protein
MRTSLFILLLLFSGCSQPPKPIPENKLDLSDRSLTIIPDSVFNKTDLVYLGLGSKNITLYPPLSALIDSGANQIAQIPGEIKNLSKLRILDLNSNNLKTLPIEITSLKNLEVLDLSFNPNFNLMAELDKLGQLPRLQTLKAAGLPLSQDSINIMTARLGPNLRIITSLEEYMQDLK